MNDRSEKEALHGIYESPLVEGTLGTVYSPYPNYPCAIRVREPREQGVRQYLDDKARLQCRLRDSQISMDYQRGIYLLRNDVVSVQI